MLARTIGYWMMGQFLAIVVMAAAVPGGASWLVLLGFVTAFYDDNLFAVHIAAVPWTDPAVYFTVQTVVQMLAVSATVASLVTLVRTNPWQHGALPNSTPPGRDKPARQDPDAGPSAAGPAPTAPPPAPAGPGPAAAPPMPPSQPPSQMRGPS